MGNILKTLIAMACIVIIAGGAYYAWSEWNEAKRLEALKQAIIAEEKAREEAQRVEAQKLTSEKCNLMARATLPDRKNGALKTREFLTALNECDDKRLLGQEEREALDMIGVF